MASFSQNKEPFLDIAVQVLRTVCGHASPCRTLVWWKPSHNGGSGGAIMAAVGAQSPVESPS